MGRHMHDPTAPTCPRCGAQRPIDYGSRVGCGSCGNLWQAEPDEPPLSPAERYAARRRLDEQLRAEQWIT